MPFLIREILSFRMQIEWISESRTIEQTLKSSIADIKKFQKYQMITKRLIETYYEWNLDKTTQGFLTISQKLA